jgi:hypothetical protein
MPPCWWYLLGQLGSGTELDSNGEGAMILRPVNLLSANILAPQIRFYCAESREKWTAYKFTKNVYEIWMPTQFKKICSVIGELPPDVNFEVSQECELGGSGLSQGLENHHLSDYSS